MIERLEIGGLVIGRAEAAEDRAACLALRFKVFVGEQSVPREIELDGEEAAAVHFLGRAGGVAVATARVVLTDRGSTAKIGRVAVRHGARGQGVGAAMMRALEADPAVAGARALVLDSQVHAIGFYERLGYVAQGEVFMDAGIPHRRMRKLRR